MRYYGFPRFSVLTIMKNKILSIAIIVIGTISITAQTYNDSTLANVRAQDVAAKTANGQLPTLTAAEHLYRADVYMSNRAFPQAREHWQKVLDNYPQDPGVGKALMGMGRSYMWERQYSTAVPYLDRGAREYPNTKEGRESLAFKGACLVRLGKNIDAAKSYEQYTVMYPYGEKIDSAYLNIIDAYREAKKYDDANAWVDKARQRFSGTEVETNALFGRLRMEIFRQDWQKATNTSDEIRMLNDFPGSMTSLDEVTYLKAFALEKLGRKGDAVMIYSAIPNTFSSYYGGLATEKLAILNSPRIKLTGSSSISARDYPAPYRTQLLLYAKSKNIDPRFVLAIMKQESTFRANAKSPSAARGLLQLVYDTALKYNKQAGYPNLQPEDLYRPDVNIAIGSLYIADLKKQFNNLYEAIAASYNGGEDNAARWLNRSNPKEPAIFASEVGFAESKAYVFKVMNNYRVYRELYTEDLRRR